MLLQEPFQRVQMSNMPEFRNAFGCEEGDNLKPLGEEITIW